MESRPTLAVSLATVVRAKAESSGFRSFIPYVFIVCLAAGFAAAFFVPEEFWSNDRWDISTAVFAGLLAFNGLLMAMGWFAFAKIYEIVTGGIIGRLLTRNNLLGLHLAFIDISHVVLISASALSVIGLISVLVSLPTLVDQGLLGACLGFTLYGLARAFSATQMMNDLVWEQAQAREAESALRVIEGSSSNRKV